MNTNQIREGLDQGLKLIRPETLSRLADARAQALSHYGAKRTAKGLVFALHSSTQSHQPRLGVWLPMLFMILGIAAILYWHNVEGNAPNAEMDIDAAILADDLPVPALTDQRLESWIKHSEP